MHADRMVGVDGRELKVPSRAAPLEVFQQRGLELRDGQWYCVHVECLRHTNPFPTPRSAKSHPWAAHKTRSEFSITKRRRDRRYRSAPIASTATQTRIDEFLATLDASEITRRRLARLIVDSIAIPSDVAPPRINLAEFPDFVMPTNLRKGPLFPGEEERLRREIHLAVWKFIARNGTDPAKTIDSLAIIVDRRFWPRGIATDQRTDKPTVMDGLSDLFSRNARRR